MKNRILGIAQLLVITILASSCLSSVSTKKVKQEGMTNESKGKEILDKAWKAQGMDKIGNHTVYELTATDKWKGMMGKMAKVWPEAEANINLKYRIGSFDSQVTYLDGKVEGEKSGLQSWNYYHQEQGADIEFVKNNDRTIFGLSAFHYFFEMTDRLRNAPLITYAGEKEFRGKKYDLVFVTWEKLKTHKAHDQYLIWVNQENDMMEFCEFTIHDPFLPGGAMIPGSIEFTDFKSVDGISIPFTQYVYIGSPKNKTSKFLHRLTLSSFQFDTFDEKLLAPNPTLVLTGDEK